MEAIRSGLWVFNELRKSKQERMKWITIFAWYVEKKLLKANARTDARLIDAQDAIASPPWRMMVFAANAPIKQANRMTAIPGIGTSSNSTVRSCCTLRAGSGR
jgi:hypothetical protein